MLKYLLDEASYTALDAALQGLYKKDGEQYKLQVEGLPKVEDTGALKNSLTNAKAERDAAKARIVEIETELDTLRSQVGTKDADRAALEASWQAKLDRANTDAAAKETKLTKAVEALTVGKEAAIIANISTVPEIFEGVVASRLTVEWEGDKPVVRVLGLDGKLSALSLDELKKELAETDRYKPIIKASDATGGGAGGGGNGGGAGSKKISQMNNDERINLLKQVGEQEFNRRVNAGE